MKTKLISLFLCLSMAYGSFAAGFTTVSPKNNFASPSFKVNFCWNPVLDFTSYRLKFALDPAFTTIIKDTMVSGFCVTVNFPKTTPSVYWKVTTGSTVAFSESNINKLNFMNPLLDGNVEVWLAADSNVTIQPDSTVSSWSNILPKPFSFSQPTAGQRPRLMNNQLEINNKRSIRFDGGDDIMTTSDIDSMGSAYVVANWSGPGTTFPNYAGFLTGQTATSISDYVFITADGTHALFGGCFNPSAGQGGYFMDNIPGGDFYQPNTATPFWFNKYKTIGGRTASGTKVFSAGNSPSNALQIGRTPGFNFWSGNIAEMIFSRNNSPAEGDSLTTYLFNKYAPPVDLGRDTIIGTSFSDPITLSVPNRYFNYSWSNGSTTNTANVVTAGTYTLTAMDVFGRTSTDDITVYPYRRLGNRTVFLCQGDSLKVNLGINAPPYAFLWSTGSTANNITIKTTGTYTVKITDSHNASIFDTINVIVDNPLLNPSPNMIDSLILCQGEKVFAITQTSFDSIRWSTGVTTTSISISTPGTYTVFGRTTAGCILNKSFKVRIAGQAPVANFSTSAVCDSAVTSFTDLSTFPSGNSIIYWKWAFGNGDTANVQNPTNVYNATGIYNASLKIYSNVGCTDSLVKTIIVKKRPVALFDNLLSCSGLPTTFVDNSIANADSIQGWLWNFAGLGTSTAKNPKFEYPSANVYTTTLTVTNSNGCMDTAMRQTTVNPSPIADFKADSACEGSSTTFTNLSSIVTPHSILGYSWDYGDESVSSGFSPPHLYEDYGIYTVRLSVTASNQCRDTAEKQVRVFALPNVDFTISNTQCTGKEIQFTDNSSSPDGEPLNNWKWFFAGQGTSTVQNPVFTFNAQGNYTIQLTAKTAFGCSGTKFRSIGVTDPPVIKFSFTPQYGPPPLNVSYTNLSPNTSNFIWDYGDGSATFQGYTPPSHTYITEGTYPVKLVATDFKGCADSLVKDILIGDPRIDGVMVSISLVPDGSFYKVVATILNNSNIEITSLGLTIHLQNGSEIREIWTGSLKPGNTVIYPFTGELLYHAGADIPVICATIESINVNAEETDLSNNSSCEEIAIGPFDVLTIYPNPSVDAANIGVMLPSAGDVEIMVYDYVGRMEYSTKFSGNAGYNNFRVLTSQLGASTYVVEIRYDGSTIRKKLMRGQR